MNPVNVSAKSVNDQVLVTARVTKHPVFFDPGWPTVFPAAFPGEVPSMSSFPTSFPVEFPN